MHLEGSTIRRSWVSVSQKHTVVLTARVSAAHPEPAFCCFCDLIGKFLWFGRVFFSVVLEFHWPFFPHSPCSFPSFRQHLSVKQLVPIRSGDREMVSWHLDGSPTSGMHLAWGGRMLSVRTGTWTLANRNRFTFSRLVNPLESPFLICKMWIIIVRLTAHDQWEPLSFTEGLIQNTHSERGSCRPSAPLVGAATRRSAGRRSDWGLPKV